MKIIYTFFVCLACQWTMAQTLLLSGQVQDSGGAPIPGSSILLSKGDTLLASSIAAGDGSFSLSVEANRGLELKVYALGFEPFRKGIESLTASLNLAPIQMQVRSEALDEVEVTAEKPMVRLLPDKTVFEVGNTAFAAGTNGFELLRRAPGVMIDNNNQILVEGKSGLRIFINGKASQLRGDDLTNFLSSLQSSDIESVEIITQPSAKYEAEGTAGIINIILKRNENLGTTVSTTLGTSSGDYTQYNYSGRVDSRSDKGYLFGNVSGQNGKTTGFLFLRRLQEGREYDAKTFSEYDQNRSNIRLGYDRYLGERNTAGILVDGFTYRGTTLSTSQTPISSIGSSSIDSLLLAENEANTTVRNGNLNLNYRFKDTLDREFTLDLDYGRYERDYDLLQPNTYFGPDGEQVLSSSETRQQAPTLIDIYSVKADYSTPLWIGQASFGGKFSRVLTDNSFNFYLRENDEWVYQEQLSNTFTYDERISAAYLQYAFKLKSWGFQLGLRTEHTWSDANLRSTQAISDSSVRRNYLSFFPSAGISYAPSRTYQWSLNYSRRINRPGYSDLNPFEYKLDELSFRKGNPFLQPQFVQSIKLSHSYRYRLNSSFSYSRVSDFFGQVTEPLPDGRNFIQQQNIANQEVWSVALSYSFDIVKGWSNYFSVNAYRSSFEAIDPSFVPLTQNTLSLYGQTGALLFWGIKGELSGWWSSPSIWGGTYRTNSLGALSAGLQRSFLEGQLEVKVNVSDIFYTIPWSGSTQFGDLRIVGSGGSDSRRLNLSVSYSFGQRKMKKAKERNTGLDQELERL